MANPFDLLARFIKDNTIVCENPSAEMMTIDQFLLFA